jgi:hypothetical protein
MARSGATVTRLLCDPLPYKNVLKGTAREKSGRKYRFSFQYKMYQAFSQIFPRAVLRIGLNNKPPGGARAFASLVRYMARLLSSFAVLAT